MSFGGGFGTWSKRVSGKPGVTKEKGRVVSVEPMIQGDPSSLGTKQSVNVTPVVHGTTGAPPAPAGYANTVTPISIGNKVPVEIPVPKEPELGDPESKSTVAIIGRFKPWPWGQHPDEAYLADAMAACGATVVRIDQDRHDRLAARAEWVIVTGQPQSYEKLSRWTGKRKTCLWTLDWLVGYPERRPIIDAAKRVDLFVSSDRHSWKSEFGIENHAYLPGACESVYPSFAPQPIRPCAFLGMLYNERREAIAEMVRKAGGTVLAESGKWLYGVPLARFLQETKVLVGDNAVNHVNGYWSSRNYTVPGAGGFLLTPRVPGLEEDFTPGKHIATYDSLKELPSLIEHYIAQAEERERIRQDGFRHVRLNHNWVVRAKKLLSLLGIRAR